ncbi:MAG: LysR family transcriptional regulator [Aquamicrobium sp.]|nr:LysR family transcriptional regulator [Aquamicrobium sp.]
MTLDQLRIFLEVARHQHVTRASEALNLTQSSVSGAIKALENRHGVRLFDRMGRRIVLTAEGSMFLPVAEELLANAGNAERLLEDLSGTGIGKLHIFTSQTIASHWLPQRLRAFRETWPRVTIELLVGNTGQCVAAIEAGTTDVAFIEAKVDEHFLDQTLVGADELCLVAGTLHPWVDVPPKDLSELFSTRWIMREKGSGTRSTFEAELRRNGLSPENLDILLALPSNEAVCAAVADSGCATVISRAVADPYIGAGRMIELPLALPGRPFHMIRHKGRHRSHALGLLEEMILRSELKG